MIFNICFIKSADEIYTLLLKWFITLLFFRIFKSGWYIILIISVQKWKVKTPGRNGYISIYAYWWRPFIEDRFSGRAIFAGVRQMKVYIFNGPRSVYLTAYSKNTNAKLNTPGNLPACRRADRRSCSCKLIYNLPDWALTYYLRFVLYSCYTCIQFFVGYLF